MFEYWGDLYDQMLPRHTSLSVLLSEQASSTQSVVPLLCQCYGHSWAVGETPGIKVCQLCGMQGYCPGCTVPPPPDAHPFLCTTHARLSQQEVAR